MTVEAGDLVQTKEIYAGSSHLSTPSAWLTFGLAANTQIDRVTVRWPGGEAEAFTTVPINAPTALVEGEGTVVTSIAMEDPVELPGEVARLQNFPNPFSETTTIHFELREPMFVLLQLYDVFGRRVAMLKEGALAAGSHRIRVDAGGLASGLYTYRLQTAAALHTGILLVVK